MATRIRNTLQIGYQLQEYLIKSILGYSDFCIIYFAQDVKQNLNVVIKEYFPTNLAIREKNYNLQPNSPQDERNFDWGLERFLQEGKALTTFQHPNIVGVLRSFEAHNTAYIVMEYEQGQSLLDILKSRDILPETDIMTILPPLLLGIKALHKAGILHHDIKPDNIYLRDKDHTPVLLGFGGARYALERLRRDLKAIITPGYTPFEQYQTQAHQGPWTDIYALSAVLYSAISGKTPVEAPKRIDAIKRRKENDPLASAIQIGQKNYSNDLLEGIDWALQLAEEDRPQGVEQWMEKLLPKSLPQTLNLTQPTSPSPKKWQLWAGITVIVVVILNAGYVFYTEHRFARLHLLQASELEELQQKILSDEEHLQEVLGKKQRQLKKAQRKFEKIQMTRKVEQKYLAQLKSEKIILQKKLKQVQQQLKKATITAKKETLFVQKEAIAQEKSPIQKKVITQKKVLIKNRDGIIRDRLPDGSLGPEMVWIPSGQFRMGDIQGHGDVDERPLHWVFVNSFAIGRYEVSFAEYDYFAKALGRKKPSDEGWGRGNRPVINVSWHDAIAYTNWLSQQTGQRYRLPTEAEWEYSARAGTLTQYWWGDDIGLNRANCKDCGSQWGGQETASVGSFSANPFGLYDTEGNVREWTCSEYEKKYSGKELLCITNPKSTRYRVERGGSWLHSSRYMRTTSRYKNFPENRHTNVGFRLVRENASSQ
ncbi:bifunctional serine/threonine-protein kinase/formylglycine-generating enzyme family protein [Candidatus Parabeggiatoa sp. HSG14]|uniref:bifunctional serine/threonine-protein kinase/formylglycine-generating enzyme family protein n=1 Tax=Candidatus Parabeggiatoa sp. HSG14 TaxID=3055593 RepID=UPI0025A77171|nr:bifunctional serine/threonine-protein kinase/formylglycine-generating enzyme family protein [Thiotrichales bacterium HSG14]